MRKLLNTAILLSAITLLSVSSCWSYDQTEHRYVRLTIVHTNDTHAHLMPFSYPEVVTVDGKITKLPASRNIGGIARRATVIKQIKKSSKGPVLVMDAGDISDGSEFSIEFQGEADIAAMNAAGYEVMTAGNHEFYKDANFFRKRQQGAHFPWLGANALYTKDNKPFLKPYVIELEDGLRVAVLGLTRQVNTMDGVRIDDPLKVAREWVPKLRSQADAVVLLTHLGYDQDVAIASQVAGIDAIIGGHTHTRLEKPILVKNGETEDAFRVGGTVVAQDFQWGSELGCTELIFRKGDAGWTLMSYSGRLIPITSEIPEDPVVHKAVESYHKRIAAKYDRVVCRAEADFTGPSPTNLMCDILRDDYHTDFSLVGSVIGRFVQGPIAVANIAEFFPFDNNVVTFSISGSDLKQVLCKYRPIGSNLEYSVKGTTLVSAKLGGKDIEDDKIYSGVANSFLAWSYFPKNVKVTDTGKNVREVAVQYLTAKKSIAPDVKPRVLYTE